MEAHVRYLRERYRAGVVAQVVLRVLVDAGVEGRRAQRHERHRAVPLDEPLVIHPWTPVPSPCLY